MKILAAFLVASLAGTASLLGAEVKAHRKSDISTTISAPAVRRQIALPDSAKTGLSLSRAAIESMPLPTMSSDGRLLFDYGSGIPTIVCSVLEVCEIDLEHGESIAKDAIDIGDSTRFELKTRTAGNMPYLIVKPRESEIETSLVIGTDRREYFMRLVSSGDGRMNRVAFRYPEEEEAKLAQLSLESRPMLMFKVDPVAAPPKRRNWRYKVKMHGRDAEWMRPMNVSDDGTRTWVTLRDGARSRGLPIVQVKDARGVIPVNVGWDGTTLVIDTVFEKGCLLNGVGRSQQRACITNEGLLDGN